METLLIATGIVTLAEMGDKTQLLALLLAARFKKPWPIVAGIFAATIVNHGFAGAAGAWIVRVVDPSLLRWAIGLTFIAMAAWTLIPDRLDDKDARDSRFGVFGATAIAFFLAEMGDKTQIATVTMAASYGQPVLVVIGTTLGMLLADVPVVFIGERLSAWIPFKLVRMIAAALFALMGVAALFGVGARLGI
jgi:putative Ca2+/H+ antiporter (TMEM165/GDT1 family)